MTAATVTRCRASSSSDAKRESIRSRSVSGIPLVPGRGDELFDEERIALGVAGDPFHVGRDRVGAEQVRGELRCGLSGKSFERDSVVAQTSELGDQLALRATVLGAVRHDQQDGDAPKVAGDITKESATRRVDPVHVIDDEDELPRGCRTRQQLDDRLEQETLPLSVVARRGSAASSDGIRRASSAATLRGSSPTTPSPTLSNSHHNASVHGA